MNISKNKILLLLSSFFLLLILYLIFFCNDKKFDSKEWKEWKETESSLSLRYDMIKDLMNHYNLTGQSRDQIIELLGDPDSSVAHRYYYNLGYSKRGIDIGTLIIVFNDNDTVVSISVISG